MMKVASCCMPLSASLVVTMRSSMHISWPFIVSAREACDVWEGSKLRFITRSKLSVMKNVTSCEFDVDVLSEITPATSTVSICCICVLFIAAASMAAATISSNTHISTVPIAIQLNMIMSNKGSWTLLKQP